MRHFWLLIAAAALPMTSHAQPAPSPVTAASEAARLAALFKQSDEDGLRRNPIVASLMIAAIALGVGMCITTLTVFRLMSGNPIEHRNDVLYAVTLDSWDPKESRYEKLPTLPPSELTWRDAKVVLEHDVARD